MKKHSGAVLTMNKSVLIFLLLFVLNYHQAKCAKILMIFPMPAKSHYILGSALGKGLAAKGHQITMVSAFTEKDPPPNYTDILIKNVAGPIDQKLNLFDMGETNPALNMLFMNAMGNAITEATLNDTNVQDLIKSNRKFDVLIIEQFNNDALKAFSSHFKIPLILFVTFGSNSWINPLVGNPAPPSYIPELAIDFSHKNFWDRLKNSVLYILTHLNDYYLFYPSQNQLIQKYFPNPPHIHDLLYNASLVLLNSHWSTNQVVPRMPNMIDIGGFHVEPAKKLPQDLQLFLDSSKNGAIYFSMGSNLKSANMPVEKRDILLKTFTKLKLNVLWKFEDENLPGKPTNVKISKWLPQQDVLAHPNVKVFITHGGLLSLIESVYHGVPTLSIPIFGDQKINAKKAADDQMGLYVPYHDITEEKLTDALNQLLKTNTYRDNMKRRSKIMRDRQTQPIDDADYWIQYVIRHQGATHLRNDGLDLRWYQYLCLDVAAFLISAILLGCYVISKMFKFLCCRAKSQKTKIKKN